MTFLLPFFTSLPDTNIFPEKWSSLDFYLYVWYTLCTEAKDAVSRQKNISVLRCCMRAPNLGLLHYPRKKRLQVVLAARAEQDSQGKGVEGVEAKCKLQPCKQRQETPGSLLKVIPPPSALLAPAVSPCAFFATLRKGSWQR